MKEPKWVLYRDSYRRGTARLAFARLQFLNEQKARPCHDCGVQYPPHVMDFDHRDASDKKFNVSQGLTMAYDRLLAEIAKCDVVCANCHREREYQRRLAAGTGRSKQ